MQNNGAPHTSLKIAQKVIILHPSFLGLGKRVEAPPLVVLMSAWMATSSRTKQAIELGPYTISHYELNKVYMCTMNVSESFLAELRHLLQIRVSLAVPDI